jgi:hypothetical protein
LTEINRTTWKKQLAKCPKASREVGMSAMELYVTGHEDDLLTLPSGSQRSARWILYVLKLDPTMTEEEWEDLKYDEKEEQA